LRPANSIQNKILTLPEVKFRIAQWRILGKTIAFTNGCFDILHQGHIASLTQAAEQADFLVIGLNADTSIKNLKGKGRPVNDEHSRALVIASLAVVDAVVLFSDPTPLQLILALKPDVLIKGGDYKPEEIVGAPEVQSWGGKVVINPIIKGFSSSSIIEKIQNSNC
jgi:rfaE bifunctional protein nucleotidyltransferase chain/domain